MNSNSFKKKEPKTYSTILVEKKTLQELRKIRGIVETRSGERVTMNDTIKMLINFSSGV